MKWIACVAIAAVLILGAASARQGDAGPVPARELTPHELGRAIELEHLRIRIVALEMELEACRAGERGD